MGPNARAEERGEWGVASVEKRKRGPSVGRRGGVERRQMLPTGLHLISAQSALRAPICAPALEKVMLMLFPEMLPFPVPQAAVEIKELPFCFMYTG